MDLSKLKKSANTQERKSVVNEATAKINGDFSTYWNQDEIELKVDVDGEKLVFLIYDKDEHLPFQPKQRSKGLQWFLSLFITLNAQSSEKRQNIIVIDEPGLYLHPKAQEDVLITLDKLSEKNEVIFTTHMPYLINPDRLDRIRLVLRDKENGTKIENKIQKGVDKETLTPIITAMGLDISKGISLAKEKNVLLEGISDYYYVQAMLSYFANKGDYLFPENIYFIPCVGATKFYLFVPLLNGWGLDCTVLLDNDKEGNMVFKKLKEELLIPEEKLIFADEKPGFCVEDLFSKNDFFRYVIGKKIEEKYKKKNNSAIVKELELNKPLISKAFLEKTRKDTESFNLSQETEENFKQMFEKIKKSF